MITNEQLPRRARQLRVIAIGGIGALAILLRAVDPSSAPHLPGFATSCGAITGVPCVFCGATRALHFLLNGDLSRALYFNWLSFPVAALSVLASVVWLAELAGGRQIVRARLHLAPRSIPIALAALLALWSLQVYLAVSQHKTELLNPNGPLYALFVR
ncbi:MAG: DUF2752 domain-containing protein [Chthoniobacterales bacterium]